MSFSRGNSSTYGRFQFSVCLKYKMNFLILFFNPVTGLKLSGLFQKFVIIAFLQYIKER